MRLEIRERDMWCGSWFKCNVDGAWAVQKEQCGVGWVLRDHLGSLCWLGARRLPQLRSLLETEAEALRWTVSMMIMLNYKHIIF